MLYSFFCRKLERELLDISGSVDSPSTPELRHGLGGMVTHTRDNSLFVDLLKPLSAQDLSFEECDKNTDIMSLDELNDALNGKSNIKYTNIDLLYRN